MKMLRASCYTGEIQSKVGLLCYAEVLRQMIKHMVLHSPYMYLPSTRTSVVFLQGLLCVPNTEQVTNIGNATAKNEQHPEIGYGESSPADAIQQTL